MALILIKFMNKISVSSNNKNNQKFQFYIRKEKEEKFSSSKVKLDEDLQIFKKFYRIFKA
jgi:hypothetical protein